MNNYFKDTYFHKVIESRQFSELTDVKKSCFLLLDHLVIMIHDLESSFFFQELREVVDPAINDEDFIHSVYYLTRPDVRVLEQGFSGWNEARGEYKNIGSEEVFNIIKNKVYYNPATGENVSEYDFYDQVVPYFFPTQYFLDHKND